MLLEEFENSLPDFNALDEQQHLQFVQAIQLISGHFKVSDDGPGYESSPGASDTLHRLQKLRDYYSDKSAIIASAIRVVMMHIESHDLDDQDGKLVHSLTGLHIGFPVRWLKRFPDAMADARGKTSTAESAGGGRSL